MSIKIIIADDHKIVREGLKALLEKESDIEIIGETENGRDTINLTLELLPDVVIMDIAMPDLNGIETTRNILSKNPNIKVIALSMHSNLPFIAGMLSAGASGYLIKDCAFEELKKAIITVYNKKTYLCQCIMEEVTNDYINQISNKYSTNSPDLSKRECEILQLLAEGKTIKEISFTLDISNKTVEAHRRHIMEKLKMKNLVDLVKYAIREGLTTVES